MNSMRKRLYFVVVTLLVLCGVMFCGRVRHSSRNSELLAGEDTELVNNAKQLAADLRQRRFAAFDGGFDPLISGLAWKPVWTKKLPLSQDQVKALWGLDDVLQNAGDHVAQLVADKIEHDPRDSDKDSKGFRARFSLAERHAERMAVLGLLTEPQAKVVARVNPSRPFSTFSVQEVQERLGFSANQKLELGKLRKIESEDLRNKGALDILTESQRRKWDQMTTEPPKPEKPDFHALTAEEAAKINLEAASPVFRVLAEKPNSFGLSEPQKGLLRKLDPIVREGVYWISLRTPRGATPTANVSRTTTEFVHEAEQVVLLGFLTEQQAQQVEPALTTR